MTKLTSCSKLAVASGTLPGPMYRNGAKVSISMSKSTFTACKISQEEICTGGKPRIPLCFLDTFAEIPSFRGTRYFGEKTDHVRRTRAITVSSEKLLKNGLALPREKS